MPDRHITDEEVHSASGAAPRVPPGAPRATCLNCGQEFVAFYCTQSHDCLVSFTDVDGKPVRKPYYEWIHLFKDLGWGVLQDPADMKYPADKMITARVMLTQWLQSDLIVNGKVTIEPYYATPEWEAVLA